MSLYFDDFEIGQTFKGVGRTFTEAEIITFAHSFDPQAMHIDRVHAEDGSFNGLIASGFHTLSIAWWLFLKMGLVERSMKIGIGVDELRWKRPVRPGDTVSLTVEIAEKTLTSANDSGRVRFAHTLRNQTDEIVMTYTSINLIWRKGQNKDER